MYAFRVMRTVAAAMVLMFMVDACGGEDSVAGDTTAPSVSSQSPLVDATRVGALATVSVTFSEPMDPATLSTSTFTLTGSGGPVSGAITLAGNTATFTPAAPLGDLLEYTARVTTGAKDLAGNALAADYSWTFTTAQAELLKVIGDIEGDDPLEFECYDPATLANANSINVGEGLFGGDALTFANLLDTTGAATPVSFAFDVGGDGAPSLVCGQPGDDLVTDGVTQNGPTLHKPWHIAGLTPGGSYEMTFTGGGVGSVRRSMRVFVDLDGSGTIEAGEVEDLIGLNGVVETRSVGPIIADANGVIIGEYWGGSTNGSGENGSWRGWSIVGDPQP